MSKSTAHANAILDAIGDGTLYSGGIWVALHTADPGTTGASECASGSAARVKVNVDGSTSPYWASAASAAMKNSGAITFPQDGGGDTATYFGLWDAATTGNFIRGGALDASFVWGTTVTPEFADQALELTEA